MQWDPNYEGEISSKIEQIEQMKRDNQRIIDDTIDLGTRW
jgi:hypothetical protein